MDTEELILAFLQGLRRVAQVQPMVLSCRNGTRGIIGGQDQEWDTSHIGEWWSRSKAHGEPEVFSPPGGPAGWCAAYPLRVLAGEEDHLLLLSSSVDELNRLAPFVAAMVSVLGSLLSAGKLGPANGDSPFNAGGFTRDSFPAAQPSPELLKALLDHTLVAGASDLHLKAGGHPVMRLHGELRALTNFPVLSDAALSGIFGAMATKRQRTTFSDSRELDFAYGLDHRARFRVNAAQQRGSLSLAFRVIPNSTPSWTELGIPEVCKELVKRRSGLVLVTGPTGSGKSTTLAALVDFVNQTRSVRIVTIEDPIEFIHLDRKSHIIQREVGDDTASFAEGLRRALRQDPDLILIGEMRDPETISIALTAAETGHLVLATLHTQSAAQTVERITDVFPSTQQPLVRLQLSTILAGTVTQRLLPRVGRPGRVAAFEIMLTTPAIRNLVREGKLHEIPSYIGTNTKMGMRTLEQSLAELVREGIVDIEEAREVANDRGQLDTLVGTSGKGVKPRTQP